MSSRDTSYPEADRPVKADHDAIARAADPLWLDVVLAHRVAVPVFGVQLAVESNYAGIGALVESAFGAVARTPGDELPPMPTERVRLRVVVEPTVSAHTRLEQWRQPDLDHVLGRGAGFGAWLDLPAGEGIMYVEEFRIAESVRAGGALIRGPALTLLNRRDRHPVHAAALRVDDVALLLHGPSGAGKSTLAYAASRAGVAVLSDDAVRVQLSPELRVWGSPGHVNLLEDARARFGELDGREFERVRANSGEKHVVPLAGAGDRAPWVRRVRTCLLARARGPVARVSVSAQEVENAMLAAPECRSDMSPLQRSPAVRALAASGGWRLTLSADPGAAVPHVLAMLDEIRRATAAVR